VNADAETIPRGWTVAPLSEGCDINPAKPKPDTVPANVPVTFVPMSAVDADSGAITMPQQRPFAEVRRGFTSFRNGDVILAKITPCFENGKVAIASNLLNGLGFGSTEFHVLRSNGLVLPEYVYHFIRQEHFRREGAENMTGSVGQKRVPAGWVGNVEFPLPPLAEQKRIVAKVEELLVRVNAARARLAKAPALLKRFRQSVLAAACSGQLTADWRSGAADSNGLPDTWTETTLGGIIEGLKYGTSKKCDYGNKGVPVLRIPNIGDGHIDQTDLKYAELDDREFEQLRLRPGDVLMIRSNGSVALLGKAALVGKADKDFAYAGYLIRLRPNSTKIMPAFLNAVLSSFDVRLQIELPARSTSGVNNINSDEVRALTIPLPPLEEQQEIMSRLQRFTALADKIEARVQAATARVEKITQAILAKAFRGELVPTEAALARAENRPYEPAAALLARIRAQRDSITAESQATKRRCRGIQGIANSNNRE
jgi:type I restriction enzyme, S subunit